MSKERLYNDTVIDRDRMPTEQLMSLYEQMEALLEKLQSDMESVLLTIHGRTHVSPECGELVE